MNVVLCNCPPDAAAGIARALVERRLAACVNLVPGVRSFYWWEGAVRDDAEVTLLIKAPAAHNEALRAAILELHPYTLPEILALPVDVARSHPAYVQWVESETSGGGAAR